METELGGAKLLGLTCFGSKSDMNRLVLLSSRPRFLSLLIVLFFDFLPCSDSRGEFGPLLSLSAIVADDLSGMKVTVKKCRNNK